MKSLGLVASEIRLVGGGAKNPLWRQMIADAFQLPVLLPAEVESAALGGALAAAAVVTGKPIASYVNENQPPMSEVKAFPNADKVAAYEEAFERHQQCGKTLFEERAGDAPSSAMQT
eukprot:gnl/TRDRNA2_/TRDRNA2_97971_c1_seq1.p1 gnl/TRDRNA2_/TRDRNA2_97971_c1~~gnl/TRDRNA2_/TRDRNA2_97971_c1_seq1.p1  ORF type:complete len:117 (+),score=30.38 gnl/TRDRNA2_/TRDRNA2_97971_c1_seq1:1-351(+)